jgi:hypothetical protein
MVAQKGEGTVDEAGGNRQWLDLVRSDGSPLMPVLMAIRREAVPCW